MLPFLGLSQQSIDGSAYTELQAFQHFQARKYQTVIADLSKKEPISNEENILLLLSELQMGKPVEREIAIWVQESPKHPMVSLAGFHLGTYYFYAGDFDKSESFLKDVPSNSLTKHDRSSYGYTRGVLKLQNEAYQDAKNLFQFAKENESSETERTELNYYEAFADYHLGNKAEAVKGFQQAKNNPDYGQSARYFIAKVKLDEGATDEVIALAQEDLSEEKTITNSGLYQLIGEAYTQKGEVDKADAFFEKSIDVHPEQPSAALYYQAGTTKFKIGNEEKAEEYLIKSGLQGGEYAQLSAFQLGRIYLKKKAFKKSITAYTEAAASEEAEIREESLYHIAKLHAILGDYTAAINYAKDYLNQYPSNDRASEIRQLIVEAYLRTSNYELAIEMLNTFGVSTREQEEAYQKVSFQKAILLFNDGSFIEAKVWFLESLKYTPNQDLKDESYYHLGEITLQSGDYKSAISYYQKQLALNSLTHYGLGYAYYNQYAYAGAIPHFVKATEATDASIVKDANVRLADCYYATKAYAKALAIYENQSEEKAHPYILIQQARTLKNLDKNDEAIIAFKQLSNNGEYAPEAIYTIAQIHLEQIRFQEAVTYFSQVIDQYNGSSYYTKALLNRGITFKNLNEPEKAKLDYEAVLNRTSSDEVALNAILGLQELQQVGFNSKELDAYIQNFKRANPGSESLASVEFESARQFYYDKKYERAISSLTNYLNEYKGSAYDNEARYFLGNAYFQLGNYEQAAAEFNQLKPIRNAYTGRTLTRLAEANQLLGEDEAAIDAYQLLISLNLSSKDRYHANKGLMNLFFENEDYQKSIEYADAILKLDWKPLNGSKQASLIKAKSYYALQELDKSSKAYETLTSDLDVFAAEANYMMALIAHERGAYNQSLDRLFDLNASLGSYTLWIDRSYLLIARNYVATDELFQAKATLRSIIQHASTEEVVAQATDLLNDIEAGEIVSDTTQMERR